MVFGRKGETGHGPVMIELSKESFSPAESVTGVVQVTLPDAQANVSQLLVTVRLLCRSVCGTVCARA
jgi:hypothetical protein